jgi:hypothetical protein
MTVSSTNNKIQYTADGIIVEFIYNFKIFSASDLIVTTFINDVETIVTNYTVQGVGEALGGTITFTLAPTATTVVTILRLVPVVQGTDYVPNDPFPAASHEDALDYLTFIDQQQDQDLAQSIKYPNSDPLIGNTLPVQSIRAGGVMGFDDDGAPTVASGVMLDDLSDLSIFTDAAEASAIAAEASEDASAISAAEAAASAASIPDIGLDVGDIVELVTVSGSGPGFPAVAGDNLTGVIDATALHDVIDDTTPTLGGTLDGVDNELNRVLFKDTAETTQLLGIISGTVAIDAELGNVAIYTIGANTDLSFSNATISGTTGFFLNQIVDGGAYTINWDASITWDGGTAPSLQANGTDILMFVTSTSGIVWRGIRVWKEA